MGRCFYNDPVHLMPLDDPWSAEPWDIGEVIRRNLKKAVIEYKEPKRYEGQRSETGKDDDGVKPLSGMKKNGETREKGPDKYK